MRQLGYGEKVRKVLAVRDRLGSVPDRVIAAEVGVSPQLVNYVRRNLRVKASAPRSERSARSAARHQILQALTDIEQALAVIRRLL